MKYKVKLSPKADKFLRKLDSNLSVRIKARLRSLKEDPFRYLKHYEGEEKVYKLRIGEYRALIDVEDELVLVRHIDHRSRIYKRK